MKENNYALFHEGAYVPELSFDIINLLFRNPKLFEIKAYHISDVKKRLFSKYREFQNQSAEKGFSNQSFIETVRPFLLTYNELNEYGRKTDTISQSARKLREAIKTATDPEKVFFDEFPQALGYHSLDDLESEEAIRQFIYELDKCIIEIKESYGQLLSRIEQCLLASLEFDETITFDNYVDLIQRRYKNIRGYKLLDYQKKLLNQLLSDLDDREKWLSAVGLSILDKPLTKMRDDEEDVLFSKLEERIYELDSLVDISKEEINQEKEEAFKIELYPLNAKSVKETVKISKQKVLEDSEKLKHIMKHLTGNKKRDLALVARLLEEISKNGK
jgi:hypothetical protein